MSVFDVGCELSGMTFRDGDGFVLVKDQCVRCKRQVRL